MGVEKDQVQSHDGATDVDGVSLPITSENLDTCPTPPHGTNLNGNVDPCRVCHCTESDRMADVALGFLDIAPPLPENVSINNDEDRTEFISPDGEIFICNSDVEAGSCHQHDALVELGCSCKNDIAVVHYACALKWFISHGSTICEICGDVAKNIRPCDFKKVVDSLKEYESLREKTAMGEPTHPHLKMTTGVDPDAVAAIRRQRLSEISLWFNPNNHSTTVSQVVIDQPTTTITTTLESSSPVEHATTKWAVEGTGILVATGLLTVTLAWLIAPRVGKKTAKSGLHILLGGICALTVIIFLRFFVLSKIKYGPARYWAILFVFWFLVFGIWASRTHGVHTT
ncbi:hypothetical protein QJS04_geneDACA009127 [Acorus gramineus]|uniref:RING-CH-type domain-containing protein n=1 Tax=Acorus gramineus TaxID=55184 RepID=A0AAV9ATX4_ACOGR|nr:hypothetical protein QJS04_geneDACA009127 [Acorus gramineus]